MKQAILAVAFLASASVGLAQGVGDTVVVAESEVEVKAGPLVVGSVPRGAQVTVESVNGDWLWISYQGTSGYINKGDVMSLDRSIEVFTDGIEKQPDAFQYNYRGTLWGLKGQNDKAIADFTQAVRLDPHCTAAYNNRAWARHNKGEYDKAIPDFNEAIRLDPDYGAAHNKLAWLLATCPDPKHRDGKQALRHAKKACELSNFQNGSWVDTLAAAYAELGDFDQAVKWQEKTLSLGPQIEIEDFKARLALYKAGKPYHQEPRK